LISGLWNESTGYPVRVRAATGAERMSDTKNDRLVHLVLDKGYVQEVDLLGNDSRAVEAARVSYQQGLKSVDRDRSLIDFLVENGHESPFEHIVFTFRIKAPLFVARQWFRHRIGSFNEISARYSEMSEEFYIPQTSRSQDAVNRQASVVEDAPEKDRLLREVVAEHSRQTYERYRELLSSGVARELARIVLPLNLYTLWYWTVNARSLMNFLSLRADLHAQWEIQQYALAVGAIFKERCPWTFTAYMKYKYAGRLLELLQRECD